VSRVLLLIALLVASGCSDGGRLTGAARGWNVVLISVDTQRADRLGGYGYQRRETSPRTDTLVFDAGVRFERAASPRGATWPAMASVLSGLYPSGHGVVRNGYRFPDDVPTLPLVLKDAGYQTGAFLNNMHKANHRGWDEFAYESGNESRLVAKAREWARGLDSSRPFFLWAHFFGPHSPYHVAKLLGEIPDVDPSYDVPDGYKMVTVLMAPKSSLAVRPQRHVLIPMVMASRITRITAHWCQIRRNVTGTMMATAITATRISTMTAS